MVNLPGHHETFEFYQNAILRFNDCSIFVAREVSDEPRL